MTEGLQVKLCVSRTTGAVIFASCRGDFLQLLAKVHKLQLWSVVAACGDSLEAHPVRNFTRSLSKLEDEVFASGGRDELQLEQVDWEAFLASVALASPSVQPKPPRQPDRCLQCLKTNNAGGVGQALSANARCPVCNWTYTPGANCTVHTHCPLGALNLCRSGCGRNFVRWANVLAWSHCAKCVKAGAAHPMALDKTCVQCKRSQIKACGNCSWCDHCALTELGYSISDAPPIDVAQAARLAPKIFKEPYKFTVMSLALHDAQTHKQFHEVNLGKMVVGKMPRNALITLLEVLVHQL
eukprot:1393983-Amphidinium_carterae.1